MKLTRIIKALNCRRISSGKNDFDVKGVSCNSKQDLDGSIFVAVKGVKSDGHQFIQQAIENKAKVIFIQKAGLPKKEVGNLISRHKAVAFFEIKDSRLAASKLAARFYNYPSKKLKVVGITGTNGKTTITYLIEAILQKAGFKPAVIGTVNYRIGNRVIPSKNTTPGPIELQGILKDMVNRNANYLVMEVSSHGLDQGRTEGIDFSSAIFTNLTQDHLDYHRTLERYFQAKARLFRGLKRTSFAVVNSDDLYGRRLKKTCKAKILTYGISHKPDVSAGDIKMDMFNTEFLLKSPHFRSLFKIKLIGRHNIYNCLAAIAWSLQEGINPDIIKRAIEEFSLVPGRLERIEKKGKCPVFVDYAHTPDALSNVIKSLKKVAENKIIAVFGCGGDRDKTKRPIMGRIVSELADYAVITNDNPRNEEPESIVRDIIKGIKKNNYCVIYDRLQAIKKALNIAGKKDIVLIAGKGHENYQIIKDRVFPFDDREAVRKCLKLMN